MGGHLALLPARVTSCQSESPIPVGAETQPLCFAPKGVS